MASSVARSRPSLTLGTVMRSGLASTTLKARLAVRGSVAQRLERTTHNREVDGSNPSGAMALLRLPTGVPPPEPRTLLWQDPRPCSWWRRVTRDALGFSWRHAEGASVVGAPACAAGLDRSYSPSG